MGYRLLIVVFFLLGISITSLSQNYNIAGKIVNKDNRKSVEFAMVLMKENGLWAISDKDGKFLIKKVPQGVVTLTVQCLGYVPAKMTLNVNKDNRALIVSLSEDNLKLDGVEVVARRKSDVSTTSYSIDRMALDNQQILNLGDVATLLPGGKTVNSSLMSDSRMALRSGSQEKGNASFGTAVEVDGVRLANNADMSETDGVSTRNISTSNIESVEIVTGIPSVEYGDLSNGVVKVNTRKGKSPFIVEGKLNQYTRQIAINKGFDLGGNDGMVNVSAEHARSFADAASPYTAYQRNTLSFNYMNIFMRNTMPLTLNVGASGNIGGYNSESDPDEELDSYSKVRDNAFRANFDLNWLLNKRWITSVEFKGSVSYADKKSENYYNTSSSSTQPYIHSLTEGYFLSSDYDENPDAEIILGPTGYWYVRGYNDSRPLDYALKLKADWNRRIGGILNRLMVGAEYTRSQNNGRGSYYEDVRYAPTWREYRYDELPAMNNVALYVEDKVSVPVSVLSTVELTAGLRNDITFIKGSDYGTVSSISPRLNGRYIFWQNRNTWVSDLCVHAGWGKSVKLPSFQVLYPSPSYSDKLSFASTSTADNKSYYAYYTYPSTSIYNPSLKWQYTLQTDVGVEFNIKGTRITVSGFHNKTLNPYMATTVYTPVTYNYTSTTAVQNCGINVANRSFSIDRETGVVTVADVTGAKASVQLPYTVRKTYVTNTKYVNASPLDRYGLEWIVDFAPIKPLHTNIRLDGNYYYYKAIDEMLFADVPVSLTSTMSDGSPYQYIGYYKGSSATSTSYNANASVGNGAISSEVNLNATVTTHIPKVRMIVSLRVECSLYNYNRTLSEYEDGTRGYVVDNSSDYFGTPYDGTSRDKFVIIYPEYYSTWDDPGTLIPFAEKFAWAKQNDTNLYNDMAKLVVRSNYAYLMNPNSISFYYSANLSVTKEIGDHVSVSFYANNFLNNTNKVRSSQTGIESSLFSSGYIPSFYYGLSLKIKI